MNEKQDVLKAILNVKKYAKNLKKNAKTMQEINVDQYEIDEVASSPSFFQSKPQTLPDEIASPLLYNKSSYRQSNLKHAPQKKDFSMTLLPKKRDIMQRDSTKHKKHLQTQLQVQSRNSSMAKSARSQQHQLNSNWQGEMAYQQRIRPQENISKTFQKFNTQILSKSNGKTENTSFKLSPPNNQQHKCQETFVIPISENPEMIKDLLKQIKYLKDQINHYKQAFLIVSAKYKEVQATADRKAQSDHLVDILKIEISDMQKKNEQLTQIVQQQNQKIRKFEESIAKISQGLMDFYQKQTEKLVRIQTQNQLLRQIENLRQTRTLTNLKTCETDSQGPNNINDPGFSSESDSESLEQMPLKGLCRNQDDMKQKYDVKFHV